MNPSNIKDNFLRTVCQTIRAKRLHNQIKKELDNHIEDQKEEYLSKGYDEATALSKAVEDMGNPHIVGKELDQTHRPLVEWSALISISLFILISAGVHFMFSRLSTTVKHFEHISFSYFIMYALIGTIVFLLLYFVDYTLIAQYAWPFYILFIIVIALMGIYGPQRYGISQLTRIPPLLFVPIYAGILYKLKDKSYLGILLAGICFLPALFLTGYYSTIGNCLLLIITCLVMLTSAIKHQLFQCKRKLALLMVYIPTTLIGIASFFLLLGPSPYYNQRLKLMFSPITDPRGNDYLQYISFYITSHAKPLGAIMIDGAPIEDYLRGATVDNPLTYLLGKLGCIPTGFIILLTLFLLHRLFKVAKKQRHPFGRSLSLGCTVLLTLQFITTIFYNLGLYNGIIFGTPPFLSYGAIGFIFTLTMLGIILSVHRRSLMIPDHVQNIDKKRLSLIQIVDGKITFDFSQTFLYRAYKRI